MWFWRVPGSSIPRKGCNSPYAAADRPIKMVGFRTGIHSLPNGIELVINDACFSLNEATFVLDCRASKPAIAFTYFQGAEVPYVFRHLDKDADHILDLEGEACVHGIMYGEAATDLNFHMICVY